MGWGGGLRYSKRSVGKAAVVAVITLCFGTLEIKWCFEVPADRQVKPSFHVTCVDAVVSTESVEGLEDKDTITVPCVS